MELFYFLLYSWLVLGYTGAVMVTSEFLIFYKTIPEEDRPHNSQVIWDIIELTLKGPIGFRTAMQQIEAAAAEVNGENEDDGHE